MFEVYFKDDEEFKNPIKVYDVKEYKGYSLFLIYHNEEIGFKYTQSWNFKVKEEKINEWI